MMQFSALGIHDYVADTGDIGAPQNAHGRSPRNFTSLLAAIDPLRFAVQINF
jgi:hypothetical protein